jgi:hypothetical protein
MSSEYAEEISTNPAANGVKFDQVTSRRPVSGSTDMNSLSAASSGHPSASTCPFGLVAAGMTNGPCHVWPQSVDRYTASVSAMVVSEYFTSRSDE